MKATADKYYYIWIVYNDGIGTGFFCHMNNKSGKSLPATITVFCADVMLFDTYEEANAFAVKNRFNTWSAAKYYIKDNNDLVGETKKSKDSSVSPATGQDLYFITNQAGWKVFYSEVKRSYYFDNKKHAYCVWLGEAMATQAMIELQKRFSMMQLSIEKLEKEPVADFKYKSLIGRKINYEYRGKIINTFSITKMELINEVVPVGIMYNCYLNWEKKDLLSSEYPSWGMDEKTLNELVATGVSVNPFAPMVYFAFAEDE